MTTSVARAEPRIRQLCCLGLDSHAIMPALLKELHDLIPSYSNAFVWAGKHCLLSNLYDENPVFPEIAPVYVSEFYNRREREVFASFTESMRGEQGVQGLDQVLKVDRAAFYKHDFYQLIYRPLNYRQFIRIVLREQGRPLGRVDLYRSDDGEFTPQEKRRLAGIAPFIAHAMNAAADLNASLVESPDSGVIIVEPSGRIQHLSSHARRLLWMAATPSVQSESELGLRHESILPAGVRRLYQRLGEISEEHEKPPVWHHRNAWGGFTFRAYWLNPGGRENGQARSGAPESELIAITVHRQEPLALKLLQRMEQLPLTRRQVQICLFLAGGHSMAAIAERLSVSRHTVDYHCREIYARFEVHTRGELIGKLALL